MIAIAQQEATEKLCNQVTSMHSEMGDLKKLITEVKTAVTSINTTQSHQKYGYQPVDDWNSVPPEQIQQYINAAHARAHQVSTGAEGHGGRQVTPTQQNVQAQQPQPPLTPPGRTPQMGEYAPQYRIPPAHYPPNPSNLTYNSQHMSPQYPYENEQQANTNQPAGSPNHQYNMEGTPQRGGN